MKEIIFCTADIDALLCFRIIAAHIPITELTFFFCTLVLVQLLSTFRSIGACFSNSVIKVFHLNVDSSDFSVFLNRLVILSEHSRVISFWSVLPMHATRAHFRVFLAFLGNSFSFSSSQTLPYIFPR